MVLLFKIAWTTSRETVLLLEVRENGNGQRIGARTLEFEMTPGPALGADFSGE